MKNNPQKEVIVALIFIIISVFLLNPFHFYMPTMMMVSLLVFALVAFGLFSSFVLREEVGDERDVVHKTRAGRIAFFVGSTVTILGIVVQSFSHSVDPWLVGALTAMVVAKLISRSWSDRNL